MKFLKYSVIVLLGGFLTVAYTPQVQAQDSQDQYRQAVQLFNKAREEAKNNDFDEAISMFNQAISLAKESDSDQSSELINRAQKMLPAIHYQRGVMEYRKLQKDQNVETLNNALNAFQEAADIAREYGDSQRAQKAAKIVTQLYYNRASMHYQMQNNEAAMQSANTALERDSMYAKAYHLKGKIYTRESHQDLDLAMELFDKAIEVGQKTNDNQTVRKAREDGHDELVFRGVKSMEGKNYTRAEELLKRALNYDSESADANYRLAELNNKQTNWDQAITYAERALQYENGGRTARAKIYFELGMAQKAKGMKQEACDSFSNAAYGSFKAPSEHQMEYELECESATN